MKHGAAGMQVLVQFGFVGKIGTIQVFGIEKHVCNVVCYLSFSATIIQLIASANITKLENASVHLACYTLLSTITQVLLLQLWSITIVALITKFITISLSLLLDIDLCFIALLFSSQFF
jgi:hypothetical protein